MPAALGLAHAAARGDWDPHPWWWSVPAWTLAWLAAARLAGLLLPPAPPRAARPAPGWRLDLGLAVGLLALTAALRWTAVTVHWPPPTPWGPDAHANLFDAWVLGSGALGLYFESNHPGYPWLVAQVARCASLDLSTAGLAVSFAAMTLAAPLLFVAVRSTLGRRAAVGAGLLFAVGPPFHAFAAARNGYALFTALTLACAAAVAAAMRRAALWPWALAGLAAAAMILVDTKAGSVVVVTVPFLLGRLLLRGTPLRLRLAGPLLAGLPLLGARWLLQQVHPVALAIKLEGQAIDLVRTLRPDGPIPPPFTGQVWGVLPPLGEVLAHNVGELLDKLPALASPLLLGLALLGAAAPLLAPAERAGRLRALAGVALHVALVATTAGAFTLIFAQRYVLHALPFVLALAAHGAWVAARLALPRAAPAALLCAAAAGVLGGLVLALTIDPDPIRRTWRPDSLWQGIPGFVDRPEGDLSDGATAALELRPHLRPDTGLVLCDAGVVGLFLPGALRAPPQTRYLETAPCHLPPGPPGPGGRLVVLDERAMASLEPGARQALQGATVLLDRAVLVDRRWVRITAFLLGPASGAAP